MLCVAPFGAIRYRLLVPKLSQRSLLLRLKLRSCIVEFRVRARCILVRLSRGNRCMRQLRLIPPVVYSDESMVSVVMVNVRCNFIVTCIFRGETLATNNAGASVRVS